MYFLYIPFSMSFSLSILLTIHGESASFVFTKIISKRSQKIKAIKIYHLILLSMLSADRCKYDIQQLYTCLMSVLMCYTYYSWLCIFWSVIYYTKYQISVLNSTEEGREFLKCLHYCYLVFKICIFEIIIIFKFHSLFHILKVIREGQTRPSIFVTLRHTSHILGWRVTCDV